VCGTSNTQTTQLYLSAHVFDIPQACSTVNEHAIVIKSPLATARAASCDGRVRLFICLSVCLSPNCKNAIFSKTKHFRAMVSIDDL